MFYIETSELLVIILNDDKRDPLLILISKIVSL